jgi:UDP-perosamine 4-acetyltransferase
MAKEKVVLIGSGGHAGVIVDNLEAENRWQIVGAVTTDTGIEKFRGYPVLGDHSALPKIFEEGVESAVIGVGGWEDNLERQRVYEELKQLGFRIVSTIHPTAVISKEATMDEGCHVFSLSVIHPGVTMGANSIVYDLSLIGHDTSLGDHILLSAGVTVGANVKIGEGALIGLGANVVSRVTIGKRSLVCSGACVLKDIPDAKKVIGNPGRVV